MRILIVSGGSSSERKISLISAKAVKKALEKNNHQVEIFDLKLGYYALKKMLPNFEIVFPVLHGEEGEGGDLQQFLALQKISYVGGDSKGFKEGWPKISFKEFCDKNRVVTPKWEVIKSENEVIKFGFPCVLKASNGGSSKEVFLINSPKDLRDKSVQKLLHSGLKLLVEDSVQGIEVTAGILGNKTLPLIEIIPPDGQWFDYKNKYTGVAKEIPFAPSLSRKTQEKIQKIALEIHQHFNLGPYSRTDFIVKNDIPYVLEVNTIPGLTSESLYPKEAKAAGLEFEDLVEKLINLCV
jgi:D-alanine-D-alanine ligase